MEFIRVIKYNVLIQFNHWIMFLMMIFVISAGFGIEDSKSNAFESLYFHMTLGVATSVFLIFRIITKYFSASIPIESRLSKKSQYLSSCVHFMFYVVLLLLPISGWLASSSLGIDLIIFDTYVLPNLILQSETTNFYASFSHVFLVYTFFTLLSMHVFAVFKHLLMERINLFSRMHPFTRK